jgi:hypothetical protein
MEAARRAYVGHYLTGIDVQLIAQERARCRELSRWIRKDLVHLNIIDGSREVTLAPRFLTPGPELHKPRYRPR